ncbi:MAG: hypothetical protein J6S33_00095 [Aeriscardovia sp.]|nr:hypothetical protein [Aeriscardovia sp.]
MKTPVEFTSMNEAQNFMNAIMANPAIVIATSGSASSRNSGGGASNRLYTRRSPPCVSPRPTPVEREQKDRYRARLDASRDEAFVLDGHDLTEAKDKAVCLLIEFVVCKDMTTGGSGPLPRE